MAHRIKHDVQRGRKVSIRIDDQSVDCFEGETLAVALMAAGVLQMNLRGGARPRAPYCNMGACFDCMVGVANPQGRFIRRRACMTPVRDGLQVRTLMKEEPRA